MAFLWASQHGHAGIASVALKLKRLSSEELQAGFHLACVNGHAKVVKMLLHAPRVDPSQNSSFSFCEASRLGHVHIVKQLLDDGRADPRASSNEAMRHAIQNGSEEVLKLLLQDGRADPGIPHDCFLVDACRCATTAMILMLLRDPRVDPSAPIQTPFLELCKREDIGADLPQVVDLFLADERVDPTVKRNMAMNSACRSAQLHTVNALLAHPRVDPAVGFKVALASATFKRRLDIVRVLVTERRVDFGAYAERALLDACTFGSTEIVEYLLRDPRVDPTLDGGHALVHAKDYAGGILKALLLDGRSDPSKFGAGILASAAKRDELETVKLLLQDGRVDPGVFESENVWLLFKVNNQSAHLALDAVLLDERVDARAFLTKFFESYAAIIKMYPNNRVVCQNERIRALLFQHSFSAPPGCFVAKDILAQSRCSRRIFVLCVDRLYRRWAGDGRRLHVANDVVRSIVCDWSPFRIDIARK
jgi:ankyrin repeat protein